MTQLTPEELAAFEERFGTKPDVLAIDYERGELASWEGKQIGFIAGLFHKQAESAKEIAHIRQCEENFAIRVLGQEKYGNSPCQAHPLELVELEIDELKAQVEGLRNDIATAYGFLWCVNNEPGTPYRYPPEKAAYEARKVLRERLTHEQRGQAINQAIKVTRADAIEQEKSK